MRIRLTQIDGKLPNLALMKLAHYHKSRGDEVYFSKHIERDLLEPQYDRVYGSAIFSFSADRVAKFKQEWPEAIVGGTYDVLDNITVEQHVGVQEYEHYDYSIFPDFEGSIGFTQRGCRLNCGFCVVPKKEGKARSVNTIEQIYRGQRTQANFDRATRRWRREVAEHEQSGPQLLLVPTADQQQAAAKQQRKWELRKVELQKDKPGPDHKRHLHLLDNDFFGQPREQWQARMREIIDGKFKVCFNQGINTRMIDDESAEALGSIQLYDDSFKVRRLYTAWDNLKDEERFFKGVDTLEKHGVKPYSLLVYMLVGYAKGETWDRVLHRFDRMVERKIRPYPMVYGDRRRRLEPEHPNLGHRTLAEFQRWAIRKYYTVVSFKDYDGSATEKLIKTADGYQPQIFSD
jgi:hypothetical protein